MLVITEDVGVSKEVVGKLIKPEHKAIFLLVNVVDKEIFAFSQDENHAGYAKSLLNENKHISPGDIVSGVVELSKDRTSIVGILTGVSSWELAEKVKHTEEQLESAHSMINDAVSKGGLRVVLESNRIFRRAA